MTSRHLVISPYISGMEALTVFRPFSIVSKVAVLLLYSHWPKQHEEEERQLLQRKEQATSSKATTTSVTEMHRLLRELRLSGLLRKLHLHFQQKRFPDTQFEPIPFLNFRCVVYKLKSHSHVLLLPSAKLSY